MGKLAKGVTHKWGMVLHSDVLNNKLLELNGQSLQADDELGEEGLRMAIALWQAAMDVLETKLAKMASIPIKCERSRRTKHNRW